MVLERNDSYESGDEYINAYNKLLEETIDGYEGQTDTQSIKDYICKNITDQQITEILDVYGGIVSMDFTHILYQQPALKWLK